MEEKTMHEMDDTANNPLLDFSIKLCAAVKKEKLLHDRFSVRKYTTPDKEAAWNRVATECNETIEYCKYRWKSMYKSFFRNYKRNNHYYLHDHMIFLKENDHQEIINDDASFIDKYNDDISRQESEIDAIQLGEDAGSESDSHTASADEINVNARVKDKPKFKMFLAEENENDAMDLESFGKRKRSNHQRACKQGLDPKILSELAEDDPEEKRPRRSYEKSKNSSQLKKKEPVFNRSVKIAQTNKILYAAPEEMEKKSLKLFDLPKSLKMVDSFTNTDIQYRHASTQCEELKDSLSQLDEIFLNTLISQLSKMNGRQKMNFKSKIYLSLMEVFDNAADFPNANECIKAQPKESPILVNTTTGELRLIRELVSLVQAAKSTPEIMKGTDVTAATLNKTPVKEKTNAGRKEAPETGPNSQPISLLSPSPEDDDDFDLHLSTENLEEEEDTPLPRSLDEIMVKPGDNKASNIMGLPRHVLQKVVKVAGSNGSTIVARNGDKRRIYRIYPKSVNSADGCMFVSKTPNSLGTFYVAPSKTGAPPNNATVNKHFNTSSSISVKTFANKSANVTNAYPTSVGNNNNSQYVYSTATGRVKSPALYKSIHPANRILNASTGLFQECSNANTQSQPPNMANNSGRAAQTTSHSSTLSIGKGTGTTFTTTPKYVPIQSSMLRPNINASPGHPMKKPIHVRKAQPVPPQRRFSICGPLPSEKTNNSPNAVQATSKNNNSTTSSISQIQISKPVSLNKQSNNMAANTSNTNNNAEKEMEESKPNTEQTNEPTETMISLKEQPELPIIETAGTIAADSLDPLYVKQQTIKTEPLDD